jgi:hypothetical protein
MGQNESTYVLDNAGVEVFPLLLGAENGGLAEEFAVDGFNPGPPHELPGRETFYQIAR